MYRHQNPVYFINLVPSFLSEVLLYIKTLMHTHVERILKVIKR